MNRTVILRSEAEADLSEAFAWYEEHVSGLGSDFLLNIEAAILSIQRNPEAYPSIYKNVRRCLVRRFPFGIFYLEEESKIIILAIFHVRRVPRKWKNRM